MSDMDVVGTTSQMTAALRAIETRRPDRLVADPLAERLAGRWLEIGLTEQEESAGDPSWPRLPALHDNLAVRTRFFDEHLLSAVVDHGIQQIVIGASGMDTRAYRINWPARIELYEVDRAAVLETKQRALGDATPGDNCTRRTVAADLTDSDWIDRLMTAGFSPNQLTAWLFEGLLLYLPRQSVHHIFEQVRDASAVGSFLAADVFSLSLLTTMKHKVAVADRPGNWQFGVEDPGALWRRYGFVARTTTVAAAGERYCAGTGRRILAGARLGGNYLVVGMLASGSAQ